MKRLIAILAALMLGVVLTGCPESTSQTPIPDYNNRMVPEKPKEVAAVQQIEVVPNSGHEFILDLKDGGRIKGVLLVETGKDAHEKVVKLINKCVQPDVVLYGHDKEKKVWEVDILLHMPECVEGGGCTLKEISLTQWLVEQGLAWRM